MGLHVLVVDDNRDAADSLADLIRMWGYRVSVAYVAATALQIAIEERPNCLILDVNMPGVSGYTLARQVRDRPDLATAKIMALSAYSHAEHFRRVEAAGFDHWLIKPADPTDLLRYLKMLEHVVKLAEQTEELAKRNVASAERAEAIVERAETLASETKSLLQDVKEELKDVKQEVQAIKEEIQEVKENLNTSPPEVAK